MSSNCCALSDSILWKIRQKQLVKHLDTLCRIIVICRDKRCVICGSTNRLQCGHFLRRGLYGVRWDLRNVHVQCEFCNNEHESNTDKYHWFMVDTYGGEVLDELYSKAGQHTKFSREELVQIYKELWNEFSRYKED